MFWQPARTSTPPSSSRFMCSLPFGGVLPHGRYGIPVPRSCCVLSTATPLLARSPWKIQGGQRKSLFPHRTKRNLDTTRTFYLLIAASRASVYTERTLVGCHGLRFFGPL